MVIKGQKVINGHITSSDIQRNWIPVFTGMTMKKSKPDIGYTLTEVMIVVAIIGIMASIGPQLLVQFTRFIRLNTARIEIQRDARVALATINRELRQAQASTIIVDQDTISQPPYSKITFSRLKPDSSTITLQYYQNGKKLYQKVGSANAKVICENLRYIAFTYPRTDDSTIISVSVTFEKETYGGGAKALQMAVEKVRIMNP